MSDRKLKRNAELREICGFNLFHGIKAVPSSRAYSHFIKNLFEHEELIEGMFNKLVDEVSKELPDYGKIQAIDGKAIDTHANGKKKQKTVKEKDGRRDSDADWEKSIKSYLTAVTQVTRSSYKWKKIYKYRTAVERVNSRLDV